MAKTFEALMKAENDNQIRKEVIKVLDIKPRPAPYMPVSFEANPQVVEEYHRMKRTLLATDPEKKIKTILFLSSTTGEGTSTALKNFAITLASGGERVLLVDANLRNPSLHDSFNLEKIIGLTELLSGNLTLKDVIKKTEVKNLSVITSGVPPSNPFSLFESNSLEYLIAQMKTQADWVLFDSPPINAYNDACPLAAKMDGVVMVVEAEKTRWEVAQNAKDRINNGKVNLLGTILNRRKIHIPDWAYKLL